MKTLRYIRNFLAVVMACLAVAAFTGKFYPVKIFDVQFTALAQRVIVDASVFACVAAGIVLIATLLFGRVYCSVFCPLGLFQDALMLIFRRKVPAQKNRPYKYVLALISFGAMIGGTAFAVRCIDPYTMSGSAASGAISGIVFCAAVALLTFCKGRAFCANVCPVGAVLGLLSERAPCKMRIDGEKCVSCGLCASKCPTGSIDFKNKTVNNETCVRCFKCTGACRRHGISFGFGKTASSPAPVDASKRKLIAGAIGVAAVAALAVKSGAVLGKSIARKVKNVLVPAGAQGAGVLAARCLNCNLCVQNCPMKILKKANADYPAVHLDYSDNGFCGFECDKCAQICPSGAIRRLTLAEKQRTQIGLADVDTDVCVQCGLCVMKCPREAITKEYGDFPRFDAEKCIGCGACQAACPVKAIAVKPLEAHKSLKA